MLNPKPERLESNTTPKPRAWIRESKVVDPRWGEYMERFSSLPTYYFEDLRYPENNRDAQKILHVLNTEIDNIALQLLEVETELDSSDGNRGLAERKVKGLRAQRLKMSQIKVIEAWRFDRGVDVEEELTRLNEEVRKVSSALLQLMDVLEIAEDNYLKVAKTLK